MFRITADKVPMFFAFHEKSTRELIEGSLVGIPYHNKGSTDIVINFADYVVGCFTTDCHSKYLAGYDTKKYHNVRLFIESAVLSRTTLPQYRREFEQVLELFGVECCILTIWLNTFLKKQCGDAQPGVSTGCGEVNIYRIIPSFPLRLLEVVQAFRSHPQESPTSKDVLGVLGWLLNKYESLRSMNIEALYTSLSVDACKMDAYSMYMYQLLKCLMQTSLGNTEFLVFNKEGV